MEFLIQHKRAFLRVKAELAHWKRCAGGILAWAMLCTLPMNSMFAQQSKEIDRNNVIAQMIMNFPLVTSWPLTQVSPDGKINICTLSQHAIGSDMEAMITASKAAQQFRFVMGVGLDDARYCHLLIIDEADASKWQQIKNVIGNSPVLTVGTLKKFSQEDGIIGFIEAEKNIGLFSEKNVRFEINLQNAQKAGITLDPMLLELAEQIVTAKGGK